tara:strand:+ start:374 stop:604 length:231 start_codon:yes stop_codon:yes gene_type:complete
LATDFTRGDIGQNIAIGFVRYTFNAALLFFHTASSILIKNGARKQFLWVISMQYSTEPKIIEVMFWVKICLRMLEK